DAFVTKLDTTASGDASLVYSTYLGGSDSDVANGIAVDSFGNAYVTGTTSSANFPVQNAFQNQLVNSDLPGMPLNPDAFVTKFDPTGAIVYSTYLGGSEPENGNAIAVDSFRQVYVTGATSSLSQDQLA